MSVTSQANVEPPPLLFGQRSPSPPSFSSPPHSPTYLQHTHTPLASPPPLPAPDVDMSTSTTLPPLGQDHDRQEDALMQDSEGLANGHMETDSSGTDSQSPPPPPLGNVAVEVAAVDEDAMDTTPDSSQGLVQANGSANPPEAPAISPSSPAQDGTAPAEPTANNGASTPIDNSVRPNRQQARVSSDC